MLAQFLIDRLAFFNRPTGKRAEHACKTSVIIKIKCRKHRKSISSCRQLWQCDCMHCDSHYFQATLFLQTSLDKLSKLSKNFKIRARIWLYKQTTRMAEIFFSLFLTGIPKSSIVPTKPFFSFSLLQLRLTGLPLFFANFRPHFHQSFYLREKNTCFSLFFGNLTVDTFFLALFATTWQTNNIKALSFLIFFPLILV